jgi:L-amino acid N-acyltransferase YncA
MVNVEIQPATASDAQSLAAIYNHYIRETVVTFEETEVTPQEMGDRVETTVYLDASCTGRGTGTCLYQELLKVLRLTPVHTVIGGVALPNAASIALHKKLGFRKVAHFKEVGFKLGHRVDVAYWQLVL